MKFCIPDFFPDFSPFSKKLKLGITAIIRKITKRFFLLDIKMFEENYQLCTYFSFLCLPTTFISSSSQYVWGTLVIVQIFNFLFLVDLHVLGSEESKKRKFSMVSGCSLVSMLVCQYANLLVCQSVETISLQQIVVKTSFRF